VIDHLQLIKFWPSRAPGKGSAAGRIFFSSYRVNRPTNTQTHTPTQTNPQT